MIERFKNGIDKKTIIVAVVFFFIGGVYTAPSASQEPRVIEREVAAEPEVITEEKIVEKEVCSKEDTWRKLKEVDDKGFDYCGQGFGIVSNIFNAQSELDFDKANREIEKLQDMSVKVGEVSEERNDILSELGY